MAFLVGPSKIEILRLVRQVTYKAPRLDGVRWHRVGTDDEKGPTEQLPPVGLTKDRPSFVRYGRHAKRPRQARGLFKCRPADRYAGLGLGFRGLIVRQDSGLFVRPRAEAASVSLAIAQLVEV